MLVPDEAVTTWVDISGDAARAEVGTRSSEHVTQIATDSRSWRSASTAGARRWSKEAYILRESTRRRPTKPENDLFAGLV